MKVLRIFKELFQKLLKARFGTAVPTVDEKIKNAENPRFLGIVSWGICPKPCHKGLFVKSPLESQKLRQNEVVISVQSSLAHLSPKERCVSLNKWKRDKY